MLVSEWQLPFYSIHNSQFNNSTIQQITNQPITNQPINHLMETLTLITPTFLFSAISLLLLAYTNRFLSYAQLVRTLKDKYVEDHSALTKAQIINLRKRLNLTKNMQLLGVGSLLLCVVTMFLIYIGFPILSVYVFGIALALLIVSLVLSVLEIRISAKSLEIYLSDMEFVNSQRVNQIPSK